MPPVTITRHETADSGEYHAHIPGTDTIGRLTWVLQRLQKGGLQERTRVAEHTLVPPEIAGQGIAAKLVEALIEDARAQGFRIVPACSYVAAAFARHPEWADLRA